MLSLIYVDTGMGGLYAGQMQVEMRMEKGGGRAKNNDPNSRDSLPISSWQFELQHAPENPVNRVASRTEHVNSLKSIQSNSSLHWRHPLCRC